LTSKKRKKKKKNPAVKYKPLGIAMPCRLKLSSPEETVRAIVREGSPEKEVKLRR